MEKETKILCPECMKAMLTTKDDKDAKCPHCGTDFIMKSPNSVVYK